VESSGDVIAKAATDFNVFFQKNNIHKFIFYRSQIFGSFFTSFKLRLLIAFRNIVWRKLLCLEARPDRGRMAEIPQTSQQSSSKNPVSLFQNISGENPEVTEIESLCIACEKNVIHEFSRKFKAV
jgi:hypothetical protein